MSLAEWNDEPTAVVEVDLTGLPIGPDMNWDIFDAFSVGVAVPADRIKRVIE